MKEKHNFGSWDATGPFAKHSWSKHDTSLICKQKKKKSAENNLHCKPLSFPWSFSHDKDFSPIVFLNGVNPESITEQITEQRKRFLSSLVTVIKGSNPLKKNLSSIKMLHFIYSSVSLNHLLLFILPSTLLNILPFLNISNTLCFSPLPLPKYFPYSKFNTEIIQINTC